MKKSLLHHIQWSGGINALAAVSAHIPCCGSQMLIGVFGVQTLGIVSTSYLYKLQFFMPILVSALLVGLLMAWRLLHRRQHLFCDHVKAHHNFTGNIRRFFILNLVVGYVVVAFLYVFLPPHKHHIIDAHVTGYLTDDHQTVLASYHDDTRGWPWSERVFIARMNQDPAPAQEVFWYNFQSRKIKDKARLVNVHLYARPTGTWPTGWDVNGYSAKPPLQFYIGIEKPEDYLLSRIKKYPALVIFYRPDCPPCHLEMNMLPELGKAMDDNHTVIVSLRLPDQALIEKLNRLDIQMIDASAEDSSALLRAFNDQRLALPFSFAVDKNGAICAQHEGLLGLNIIKDWREKCFQ